MGTPYMLAASTEVGVPARTLLIVLLAPHTHTPMVMIAFMTCRDQIMVLENFRLLFCCSIILYLFFFSESV
jgi:hypothetical protein